MTSYVYMDDVIIHRCNVELGGKFFGEPPDKKFFLNPPSQKNTIHLEVTSQNNSVRVDDG